MTILKATISFVPQRGAALLIFMLIVGIAALSLMFNRFGSHSTASANQATERVLAQAKDAIIGWSASQDTPGMLPCPEDTTLIGNAKKEGQAKTSCPLPAVGRLPWRTLKLPQLRDDFGEPLWYALSEGFRSPPINGNTPAKLMIDGTPNSAVAIIFSPGAQLTQIGQSRPTPTQTHPPAVEQYLENFNIHTGSFVSTGVPGQFNDKLLSITADNLFRAVNRRILAEFRGDDDWGLINYHNDKGYYPPAAANLEDELTLTNTVKKNNWYALVNYSVDATGATLKIDMPTVVSCKIIPNKSVCQ